ncbi:MAG: type II secretion system protein [Patescibacteria group bacterium]|nr:type II secretion system protein [Patescibacteria group bacterium]
MIYLNMSKNHSFGFTLIELLVVITIIGILSNIGLNTFTSAQKKSRDAKRKAHLKQLKDSFEAFSNDAPNNTYPPDDSDGNLKVCGADFDSTCIWGTDTFENETGAIYMIKLPIDPTTGYSYYYSAQSINRTNDAFYLCSRLENTNDPDVPKDGSEIPLGYVDTDCTTTSCNYCISSTNIALPATGAEAQGAQL